jgi:predicted house-cleaning NTP pyrophosphatase (Maf/HAM1 superfamily)
VVTLTGAEYDKLTDERDDLQKELAAERERRKAAVMALAELIAVADESDALMMERLYGKPHGVEHKARTLDHMQRKSEAWRNARVYLTRYRD